MSAIVKKLEKYLGYQFSKKELAELALTHRSAERVNNERLEFLGDAVLGFIIADELLRRYPEAPEGELSRMRAQLVNQQTLADVANVLCIGDLLLLGPGELKSGGRQRASILADALEAVLGAVYLDGGLAECGALVQTHFSGLFDVSSISIERGKDPKTTLQELLQGRALALPHYEVVSIDGEAHKQTFVVSCQVVLLAYKTQGIGSNRRLAEQQAAQYALQALGL
jgi:ribonuclease-3